MDMFCSVRNDHKVSVLPQTHFARPFTELPQTTAQQDSMHLIHNSVYMALLSASVPWNDWRSTSQMGKLRVSMFCLLLLLLLREEQGWPILSPRGRRE